MVALSLHTCFPLPDMKEDQFSCLSSSFFLSLFCFVFFLFVTGGYWKVVGETPEGSQVLHIWIEMEERHLHALNYVATSFIKCSSESHLNFMTRDRYCYRYR